MLKLDHQTLKAINQTASNSLTEHRAKNFELFMETPAPAPTDEEWKYVPIAVDFSQVKLPTKPGLPLSPGPFISALSERRYGHALVVDGFLAARSGPDWIKWGPTLTTSDNGAGLLDPTTDKFASAAAAFGGVGLEIKVPKGFASAEPIVVELQATQPDSIVFPEISISTEPNSQVSVVIILRSSSAANPVISPVVGLRVGDSSILRCTTLQLLGEQSTMVAHHRAQLGRDATLHWGEAGLGGELSRVDLGVELASSGSSAEIVGLYFGEREQILDYRVVIDHRGKSTSSDVLLKGAVEDQSQSVFNGLLRIHPGALRTSAFETNRNLVLSDGAKAHSVPNLEILCDDVVCGHGSSVGQLETEHLYYLMSRGLSQSRSERLLVRGFFEEVIDRLPQAEVGDPLRELVNQRFAVAQAVGRIR